jgi:predicted transcriptional regulator of viral defense system
VLLPGRLREAIPQEVFDYQTLMQGLAGYASPRDKVTDLLSKGIVIRLKKGLYLFGEPYRRALVSRELIANLLYGPSYISLDYALQFHGMIPEAVETVTSVTTGRSRKFSTPVGSFTYRRITLKAFRSGMDLMQTNNGPTFLMATPEKALADKVMAERGIEIANVAALREHLTESLRIAPEDLTRLNLPRLQRIAASCRSRRLDLLARLVKDEQSSSGKET